MAVKYDKNKDYQADINKYVQAGDYYNAALAEQARNAKIDGEGIKNYNKTYYYQNYLNGNNTPGQVGNGATNITYTKGPTGDNTPSYVSKYNSQLQSLANQYNNTDPYTSKYTGQLQSLANQYNNAAPYASKYNQQLQDLTKQYLNDKGFSYGEAPTYTNQYDQRIQDAANAYLNRAAFEYQAENDPLYQDYRRQYIREGNRAMQNTLGQLAARTGGMASSYASSAAAQANNYYMQQLADKIPELRQAAYQMYQDEGNTLLNRLNTLRDLENTDYGRYQDDLTQYNQNRNFDYDVYNDRMNRLYNSIGLVQDLDNTDYGRYRDNLDQIRNSFGMYQDLDDTDYGRYQDTLQRLANSISLTQSMDETDYGRYKDEVNRISDYAETLAAYGDFSGYKALGYSDDQIANMRALWLAEQMADAGTGSGGGSSSGGSSGGGRRSSGGSGRRSSSGSSSSNSSSTPTATASKSVGPTYADNGATTKVYNYSNGNNGYVTPTVLQQLINTGKVTKQVVNGRTVYTYKNPTIAANSKTKTTTKTVSEAAQEKR